MAKDLIMRNIIYLIIICASLASCDKPTQIQISNERADEKIYNYGLGDYYSDTGRIRNVEHIYIEYGEISDIWVRAYRNVSSDDVKEYEMVDDIVIYKIEANSTSSVIEIEMCDRVEVRYFINAYNHYYRNADKIATEKRVFEKTDVFDNMKYGKVNKITIKD